MKQRSTHEYEWTVRLRDDRMGFGKRLTVHAITHTDAITAAIAQMAEMGYGTDDLAIVEMTRGRIVRLHATA